MSLTTYGHLLNNSYRTRVFGSGKRWANLAQAYATYDCGQLCDDKRCTDYNCNCTNGCSACGGVSAIRHDCGSNNTSGGSTSGSGTWYRANSTTLKMGNVRCDGSSNRWATTGGSSWKDKGYEVVVYLQPESSSMSSDGHIGLKHWGPNHTSPCEYKINNECCCWYDIGIREGGNVVAQIERPHPKNYTKWTGGNIGRHIDNGKVLGIRWHIRREGSYRRLMGWVDTSGSVNQGNWKQIYNILDTGQIMPNTYKPTATQYMQIRISDIPCSKIHMRYGPYARKIV